MFLSCGKEKEFKMTNLHTSRNFISYAIDKGKVTSTEVTPAPLDEGDSTLPKVIAALGGSAAFEALPILDLGQRSGHSGYLDFLTAEDLSAPVMKGIDCSGRPFVALRMEISETSIYGKRMREDADAYIKRCERRGETTVTAHPDGSVEISVKYVVVETMFRRYDRGSLWTSGGGDCLICASGMKEEDINWVSRLIAGEQVGRREYEWLSLEATTAEIEEAWQAHNEDSPVTVRRSYTSHGTYLYYEEDSIRLV
jgi:hypothetical protein